MMMTNERSSKLHVSVLGSVPIRRNPNPNPNPNFGESGFGESGRHPLLTAMCVKLSSNGLLLVMNAATQVVIDTCK